VTFRIVGFSYGNDGLRVDYVDNAQEDEEDEEPGRPPRSVFYSRVDEVLRWIDGDFGDAVRSSTDGAGAGRGDNDNEENSAGATLVPDDDNIELPPSAADVVYGDDESADGDDDEHDDASDPDLGVAGSSAKERWEHLRIKLDALHAMMRFQRTLRKKHGCHDHFLSRLRDAFFIINNDDVDNLKSLLKGRFIRRRQHSFTGTDDELWRLAEEYVDQRYLSDYTYFAHRVRRSIPRPKLLEAELRKVVDLYANCIDAATGKQLFTDKTWRVFRSTIKHIRKGCLSDHPDLNYYFLSRVTKDGRRVYYTIRGTSQLEGYHFHLRSLVAQASHSPRLLVSLLRGFNYRWNRDIACDNGDLPLIHRG